MQPEFLRQSPFHLVLVDLYDKRHPSEHQSDPTNDQLLQQPTHALVQASTPAFVPSIVSACSTRNPVRLALSRSSRKMSDNQNQMQMPAAPSAGGAPGQYPPLNIPQSTIEANAMTDAMNNNGNGLNSPGSAGGPRRAAPEPNKRALYVGGLDPRVTEEVLKQIFETTGHVQSVKIIPDKNVSPDCPFFYLISGRDRCFCLHFQQSWLPGLHAHACACIMQIHVLFALAALLTSISTTTLRCTKNHRPLTTHFPSSSQKDSTTASLNTTIPSPPKEQCRLSTEDVSTSR